MNLFASQEQQEDFDKILLKLDRDFVMWFLTRASLGLAATKSAAYNRYKILQDEPSLNLWRYAKWSDGMVNDLLARNQARGYLGDGKDTAAAVKYIRSIITGSTGICPTELVDYLGRVIARYDSTEKLPQPDDSGSTGDSVNRLSWENGSHESQCPKCGHTYLTGFCPD